MLFMEGLSENDCGFTPGAAGDVAQAIVAAGIDLSCFVGAGGYRVSGIFCCRMISVKLKWLQSYIISQQI